MLTEPSSPNATENVTRSGLLKAFDVADNAWVDAIRAHASAELKATGSTDGSFHPFTGWKPAPEAVAAKRQLASLAGKVREAARDRDRRGEDLLLAKVAYAAKLNDARRRNGLAVMPGNMLPSTSSGIIY